MLDVAPGIHYEIPADVYHRKVKGLVSKGALDRFAHAPASYLHWLSEEERETPALMFGRAFHCAVLEPDEFTRLWAVEPEFGDCRKTENKKRRDAWRAENASKGHVSAEDWARALGMAASLRRHAVIGSLLARGRAEVTARWRDSETGLQAKARADIHAAEWQSILDLKTTEDARAAAFSRSCEQYRYDGQEAHYVRGFGALDAPVEHFVFGVCEKDPPYLCAAYTLHAESVMEADAINRSLMRRMADCLASDSWPGLQAEMLELRLRKWRLENK